MPLEGKWVFTSTAEIQAIKRVSIEGGQPETLVRDASWGWSVSPDGKKDCRQGT